MYPEARGSVWSSLNPRRIMRRPRAEIVLVLKPVLSPAGLAGASVPAVGLHGVESSRPELLDFGATALCCSDRASKRCSGHVLGAIESPGKFDARKALRDRRRPVAAAGAHGVRHDGVDGVVATPRAGRRGHLGRILW